MKNKISQDVIDAINRIAPETLEAHGVITRARQGYICPFCGNGSGKDGTGISPLVVDSHVGWKCHKCGESFNNMKIFSRHYNLDKRNDFQRLVESICADFNISIDHDGLSFKPFFVVKHKGGIKMEKDKMTDQIVYNFINADLQADIQPLRAFVAAQGGLWRGLPIEILERFGCRYIAAWTPPKARAAQKYATPSPRMIIPANADGLHSNYLARLTCKLSDFDEATQKFVAEKQHAGTKTLFNSDALSADLILAFEGYIDAMSAEYAGFKAVAVGGADGYQLLVDAVAALEKKPRIIILFDPDTTGRKFAPKLQGALRKIGCKAVIRFISSDTNSKLDVNQILQENGVDYLGQDLFSIEQDALKEIETLPAENFLPFVKENSATQIADDMKRDLNDAIIWLKSLTPETFTVADARDKCRSVALAAVFGFHNDVENFFDTLKTAKKLARKRLKENDDAEFTQKLPDTERLKLSALAEGVNVDFIRRTIDRKITAVTKEHDEYLRQVKVQTKRAEFEQRRAEKAARVIEAKSRLDELRAMEPSPERNAEMIQLIRDSCDWHCNRQGVPEYVKATAANIDKIFTLDPNIDGLFGYDQFQQADVFLRPPIWNSEAKKGDEWQDRDDAQLQLYLRRNYGEFTNKDLTLTAVTSYSDARRFHEVKEFFKALPKWDGKPRVKNLFVKFLGAEDSDFTHEVTLNVLTAAVARIFHPGCDYQLAPILLGEQGIGKSYCLSRLFGKWYGSLVDDVGDPHAIDAIQKLWGVEIKEMAAMKKDIDANKRFIDSAKDTRRQAYARRATTVPRHCVFLITTNNKMCLTDMTGNRRYPIIVCNNKARHYVEGLTDDYIKQIWAEVYAHYNDLFKDGFDDRLLELSKDAQIKSDEIAEEYLRDDGMESEIRAHLETKIPPLIIWYLLSREERRKFFSDGSRIQIEHADLEARFKNRAGKKYDTKLAEFEKACEVKEGIVRKFTDRDDRWQFVFYGAEERQHICAVEIYNECFGNDKRKSPTRINEILNRIDNWKLGAGISKADPAYLRQRKVFYRNEN